MRRELTVPVTVEFEDVDSYGIAHHTKLISYLERARLRFWLALEQDIGGDVVPVMYDLRVRYSRPARMLDELEVSVFVLEFDSYRLKLGYRIRRDGALLVRASSVIALRDMEGEGLVEASPQLLQALRGYMEGETP